MKFPKFHGITLAGNAYIQNAVVETLETDPAVTKAGRLWYNSTEKSVKLVRVNTTGSLEVKTIGAKEDLEKLLQDYKDIIASVSLGNGTALIGFVGQVGVNGNYTVAAGTVETVLKDIISKVDGDIQALNDYIASNNQALADEVTARTNADNALQGNIDTLQNYVDTNFVNKTTNTAQVVVAETTFNSTVNFKQDIIVTGAIRFDGDVTEVQKEVISVSDNVITLNSDVVTGVASDNAGIEVSRGDAGKLTFVLWDEANDYVSVPKFDAQAIDNGDGTFTAGFVQQEVCTINDLTKATSLITNAAADLENRVTVLEDDLATETQTRNDNDAALQTELDASQVGAGLATDGTYVAKEDANYIATAVSLKDADNKLDAALKSNVDTINSAVSAEVLARTTNDNTLQSNIDAEAQLRTDADTAVRTDMTSLVNAEALTRGNADTALQTELDASQVGAGLAADGAYVAKEDANYIAGATSLKTADNLLDAALKTTNDLIGDGSALPETDTTVVGGINNLHADVADIEAFNLAIQTEVDATQTGAGLAADGSYTADMNANYISTVTSLKNADSVLDSALKVEENARIAKDNALQTELDGTQVGAGLEENGSYAAIGAYNETSNVNGGHYIGSATSLKAADKVLDGALKVEETARIAADTAMNGRVTTVETEYLKKNTNGTYATAQTINTDVTITGNVVIEGNITQSGTVITTVGEEVLFEDNIVVLNSNADVNASPTLDAGFAVNRGNAGILNIVIWDESEKKVSAFNGTWLDVSELQDGSDMQPQFDNVAFEADVIALDSRVDILEEKMGSGMIGDLTTLTTDNKTTIVAAINEVDNHVDNAQAELDATQTGAGLAADGSYVAETASNYLNASVSLKDADKILDGQLKTTNDNLASEVSARTALTDSLQSELNASQAGAGLATDGSYVVKADASYIGSASTLKDADEKLDAALKSHVDSQTSTGTVAGTDGAGTVGYFGATGTNSKFNIAQGTVAAALDAIVGGVDNSIDLVDRLVAAINGKTYSATSAANTVHTITHNLGTEFIDVSYWVGETVNSVTTWSNAIVSVTIVDVNTIVIELTEAKELRVMVEAVTTVAL